MSQELNGTLTNSADLIGNISIGAESGTDNYNDLINKPSINSVTLQGNKTTSDLLIDYNDLLNKPTIPAAQVNSDWNAVSGVAEILNKPTIPAAQVNSDWNAVSGVAEILNKPTVYQNASSLPISISDLTDTKTYIDNNITLLITYIDNKTTLIKTVSGNNVYITDGADNVPVKSLVSQIVAVQSGSGTPSPSNPRSISGFSQGVITVTDNDQITNTYTFAFGQTVYGGHFDNKGNLVVTHGFTTLDGSLNYNPNGATSNTSHFIITISGKAYGRDNFISDKFATALSSDIVGNAVGRPSNSSVELYLPPTVAQTTAAAKQWFSDNPTQLVYELGTPTTLTITSQDIPTLLECNIFSNCGDVEVEYFTNNANDIIALINSIQ